MSRITTWQQSTRDVQVMMQRGDAAGPAIDTLAVEEPLEIRFAGYSVAVTMRTPGDDLDLAAGFLYTEGIIRGMEDVASISHCETDEPDSAGNIVNINPTSHAVVDPSSWQRNFFATSSCGVCGKASIQSVRRPISRLDPSRRFTLCALRRLPGRLQRAQEVFSRTGGLHAAGLFDLDGNLILLREDIGRHNAVDKVIGAMVRAEQVPLVDRILFVSSRASFEIVQKALAAGIPAVAACSAASSLAVDLARECGLVLIGFLRADGPEEVRFNVYAGAERIESQAPPSG